MSKRQKLYCDHNTIKIEINNKNETSMKTPVVKKKSHVANVDTKTAMIEINNEIVYVKTMDKGQNYYSEEILTLNVFIIKQQ